MNYETDVRIDENALDLEWLLQPQLMINYAQAAAEAARVFDLKKEKLSLTRAELDKDIRTTPEKYDVVKVTETVIENTIIMQEEYIEANREMIEAKFQKELAYAAVTALDQKKTALENLVRLHGQQYFAGPKVPRELSEERKKREERSTNINQKIGIKLNRK